MTCMMGGPVSLIIVYDNWCVLVGVSGKVGSMEQQREINLQKIRDKATVSIGKLK